MPESNRLPAELRYERDPTFKALVDCLIALISAGNYTPTELREALILAATHVYMHTPERPVHTFPAHLRDDAPSRRCSVCGRRTWSPSAFGSPCGMPQPAGDLCTGRFAED